MSQRIYFFNDTSDCHSGSRAVMQSLRYQLRRHEIIATHRVGDVAFDAEAFAAADAIFVNGEGTIHDGAPAGLFLLDMLRLGQASGKRTLLVNAVFQERPSMQTRALRGLDLLTVREPRSADWAAAAGGRPLLRIDSAADPVIRTHGGTRVAALPSVVKSTTHPASPTRGWLDDLDAPYFGLEHDFADVIETLKTTDVYVTGQHHGVYAAGLAGIPFVALASNCHKIESLLEWAGLDFALCRRPQELPERMDIARARRAEFARFREFLLHTPVLEERAIDEALASVPRAAQPFDRAAVVNAEALRRRIAGGPLVVLLHGPSLEVARAGRERFADLPACFAAVNRFEALEESILRPAGRQLDLFVATAEGRDDGQSAEVARFLAADGRRVAIVRANLFDRHAFQLRRWQSQIVRVPDGPTSMNGLAWLLAVNGLVGASDDIVVFGADGVALPRTGIVGLDGAACTDRIIRYEEYFAHGLSQLLLETQWLNTFARTLGLRAPRPAEVHVANPGSAVTAFPRIDGPTAFAMLSRHFTRTCSGL